VSVQPMTPQQFRDSLTLWAASDLFNAGNTQAQVEGHISALTAVSGSISQARRDYQALWDDRNLLALELSDLRDNADTARKAGALAAIEELRDRVARSFGDPIEDLLDTLQEDLAEGDWAPDADIPDRVIAASRAAWTRHQNGGQP
jgi:hypothetical protein